MRGLRATCVRDARCASVRVIHPAARLHLCRGALPGRDWPPISQGNLALAGAGLCRQLQHHGQHPGQVLQSGHWLRGSPGQPPGKPLPVSRNSRRPRAIHSQSLGGRHPSTGTGLVQGHRGATLQAWTRSSGCSEAPLGQAAFLGRALLAHLVQSSDWEAEERRLEGAAGVTLLSVAVPFITSFCKE